jgi:hypothetical protein
MRQRQQRRRRQPPLPLLRSNGGSSDDASSGGASSGGGSRLPCLDGAHRGEVLELLLAEGGVEQGREPVGVHLRPQYDAFGLIWFRTIYFD